MTITSTISRWFGKRAAPAVPPAAPLALSRIDPALSPGARLARITELAPRADRRAALALGNELRAALRADSGASLSVRGRALAWGQVGLALERRLVTPEPVPAAHEAATQRYLRLAGQALERALDDDPKVAAAGLQDCVELLGADWVEALPLTVVQALARFSGELATKAQVTELTAAVLRPRSPSVDADARALHALLGRHGAHLSFDERAQAYGVLASALEHASPLPAAHDQRRAAQAFTDRADPLLGALQSSDRARLGVALGAALELLASPLAADVSLDLQAPLLKAVRRAERWRRDMLLG